MVNSWLNAISSLTLPLKEANWEFKLEKTVIPPLLVVCNGYLSATQKARHLMACTKLTGWKDEQVTFLKPDKFATETTHDFLIYYQKYPYQGYATQLCRFQICSNDTIATEIAKTLATAMVNCEPFASRYLLDPRYEYLWQEIAEIKLKTLETLNLQIWKYRTR